MSEHGPGAVPEEPLEAAEADLARGRDTLTAAARGAASASEVKETLTGYLEDHGPALREAAASMTEDVRRQTLEELYKWRAQLEAQLEARRKASGPDRD